MTINFIVRLGISSPKQFYHAVWTFNEEIHKSNGVAIIATVVVDGVQCSPMFTAFYYSANLHTKRIVVLQYSNYSIKLRPR